MFEFENKPTNRQFNRKWLNKHWQWGFSCIKKNGNVYDIDGLMQYLVLFDKNVEQKYCPGVTYFPQNANVIASTFDRHASEKTLEISGRLLKDIVNHVEKLYYTTDEQKPIFSATHMYWDKEMHLCRTVADKLYIFTEPDCVEYIEKCNQEERDKD